MFSITFRQTTLNKSIHLKLFINPKAMDILNKFLPKCFLPTKTNFTQESATISCNSTMSLCQAKEVIKI